MAKNSLFISCFRCRLNLATCYQNTTRFLQTTLQFWAIFKIGANWGNVLSRWGNFSKLGQNWALTSGKTTLYWTHGGAGGQFSACYLAAASFRLAGGWAVEDVAQAAGWSVAQVAATARHPGLMSRTRRGQSPVAYHAYPPHNHHKKISVKQSCLPI